MRGQKANLRALSIAIHESELAPQKQQHLVVYDVVQKER